MAETTAKFLVSVIIPTYNRADVVSRAVNSVLKQSYKNIEIIVVDDASEDQTARVVQQLKDENEINAENATKKKNTNTTNITNAISINYISHESNLGGSEARNTGISLAQGEFVAFLDSDDIWLPDKLQLQLNAIALQEKQNNLDNLVCYSQFKKSFRVFYQASVLPAQAKQERENIPDYFWLAGGEMLTSTLLISRALASKTLFKKGLLKHQDLDFVISLEKQGAKFVFVPQVLTIWHNEPRCDRISRQVNYQISLDWIEHYRQQISEGAYQGFLLKEIVPKMIKEPEKRTIAAKLIFKAWRAGVISTFYGLYLLLKSLMPLNYQQQIKRQIKRQT